MLQTTTICGTNLLPHSKKEVLEKVFHTFAGGKSHWIATINPEYLLRARGDNAFRLTIESADVHTVDGFGLQIFISQCERVTGVDLMLELFQEGHLKDKKVFLYGAQERVAQGVSKQLSEFARAIVVLDGFQGERSADTILEQERPDIVFVALGSPKQDEWIARAHAKHVNGVVFVGVGGAFDMIGGVKRRAPELVRHINMEWLWRGIIQPSRIPRILNATVRFPILAIYDRINARKT